MTTPPPTLSPTALAELKALMGKATSEPWRSDADLSPDDVAIFAGPRGQDAVFVANIGEMNPKPVGLVFDLDAHNGRLIAAMRNALPGLIAAAERVAEMDSKLDDVNGELDSSLEDAGQQFRRAERAEADRDALAAKVAALEAERDDLRSDLNEIKQVLVAAGIPAQELVEDHDGVEEWVCETSLAMVLKLQMERDGLKQQLAEMEKLKQSSEQDRKGNPPSPDELRSMAISCALNGRFGAADYLKSAASQIASLVTDIAKIGELQAALDRSEGIIDGVRLIAERWLKIGAGSNIPHQILAAIAAPTADGGAI